MFKKFFSIFFLILSLQNLTAEIPTYISLGWACGPGLVLRQLGLRKVAYPFDWVISPFDSLCKALDDDFQHHLQDLTLIPGNNGVTDYYGFQYTHDWPTIHDNNIDPLNVDFVGNNILHKDWEAAVPYVREKYQRRIDRFRQACLGNDIVFFMHDMISKEQAIYLRDLIERKYPELDFVLITFGENDSFASPWNLDKIRNFYSSYLTPFECKKFLDVIVEEFGKSNY